MKKALYLIILFLSVIKVNECNADTIPEGGFENWTFVGWTYAPAGWILNNSELLAPQIYQDSDAHSGLFAMKVSYKSEWQPQALCNFLLTSHPMNVGGYVKNQLGVGDSVQIFIRLFANQLLVDSGYGVFFGGINPNYSSFIIPISQNSVVSDSCEIEIIGGMTLETSITFDDLQFDFSQGISNLSNTDLYYFPNPCRDNFFLRIDNPAFRPERIEAYNMTGQQCKLEMSLDKDRSDGYIVHVNTSSLTEGVWLILLIDKNESRSIMLQKY